MENKHKILVLLQNTLRVQDNALLTKAQLLGNNVTVMHVLDDCFNYGTWMGISRMSERRRAYLLENLRVLEKNLKVYHLNLLAYIGDTAKVVADYCVQNSITHVVYPMAIAPDEQEIVKKLVSALPKWIKTIEVEDGFLIDLKDQYFVKDKLPNVFTVYRKKVEKVLTVYPSQRLKVFANPDFNPELEGIFWDCAYQLKYVIPPGEDAAWERVDEFMWKSKAVSKYKHTRDGLLGDFSSQYSAYLALGNICPKALYREIIKYEERVEKNSSTYWLMFELLWREFFRCTFLKYGNANFYRLGWNGANHTKLKTQSSLFENWCFGNSGHPWVDAFMNELNTTGWMSNRGRQIVASYLINDMGLDYRLGAVYFEQQLLDFDVCSNQGNWLYLSGYGNDPRGRRRFDLDYQQEKYDPDLAHLNYWSK